MIGLIHYFIADFYDCCGVVLLIVWGSAKNNVRDRFGQANVVALFVEFIKDIHVFICGTYLVYSSHLFGNCFVHYLPIVLCIICDLFCAYFIKCFVHNL